MAEQNLIERAIRLKLRFPTYKGLLSVEDLFDFPLKYTKKGTAIPTTISTDELPKSLNDLYRMYSKEVREEEDYVEKKSLANEKVMLALEVIKYIIDVKLAEQKELEQQSTNAARKQELLEVMKQKRARLIQEKTLEELEAEYNSL